jgi:hypothetical protein
VALAATVALAQSGALPSGWRMRVDAEPPGTDGVRFSTMAGGFHVMTGPAAIFYRPDMVKSGTYQLHATFTQMSPTARAEAYGLVFGGRDLDTGSQKYTYFLIRQDGQFLIKRRDGSRAPTLADWTSHSMIRKTNPTTKGTNALAVAVGSDRVRFLVNGTEVSSARPADVDTSGMVGLRINHNLNVHIDNFGVK